MPTISVEVDVDLSDFDTDDLADELDSRLKGGSGIPGDDALNEIYYAFKFGQEARAVELTRAYVCDALGKIL